MGRLARAHAVEKYSWAQISSRVCSVYEIVLQRTRVAG
jgi:hypothetical protein